ncbi:hypothetical protein, partial [Vibrio parahaemolyticus]|uniref:hypothetical protein n=1 Tax=Vibrio parahaemolyticus TaxID=670 RepID=UPI001C3061FF
FFMKKLLLFLPLIFLSFYSQASAILKTRKHASNVVAFPVLSTIKNTTYIPCGTRCGKLSRRSLAIKRQKD